MSAVAWRRLAALVLALSACGGDEGILVSVTQDPETRTRSVDTLRFVIGVDQGDGTFLAEPQPWTFEPRRDLTERPFDLLIHDTDVATPSSIVVAVIGSAEGSDTAFGGFTAPQPFVDGKVIQRDVEIGEPGSYVTTPTGA